MMYLGLSVAIYSRIGKGFATFRTCQINLIRVIVGHFNVLKACAPAKSINFLINLSFANSILTCSHASAINPLNCTGSDG